MTDVASRKGLIGCCRQRMCSAADGNPRLSILLQDGPCTTKLRVYVQHARSCCTQLVHPALGTCDPVQAALLSSRGTRGRRPLNPQTRNLKADLRPAISRASHARATSTEPYYSRQILSLCTEIALYPGPLFATQRVGQTPRRSAAVVASGVACSRWS